MNGGGNIYELILVTDVGRRSGISIKVAFPAQVLALAFTQLNNRLGIPDPR